MIHHITVTVKVLFQIYIIGEIHAQYSDLNSLIKFPRTELEAQGPNTTKKLLFVPLQEELLHEINAVEENKELDQKSFPLAYFPVS